MIPDWVTNPHTTIDVAIVGAGGTGSFLASHVARMQRILTILDRKQWNVEVFDPKDVTESTIAKQLFLTQERGMNKAVALTERLNRSYNLQWKGTPHTFDMDELYNYNMVIGCTDSIPFRNDIMFYLKGTQVWLDSGCFKDYGQIIAVRPGHWPDYNQLGLNNFENHPDSCDAIQSLEIQHPAINPTLASIMYGWLYNTFVYYRPPFLQAYINLESMKMTSGEITHEGS